MNITTGHPTMCGRVQRALEHPETLNELLDSWLIDVVTHVRGCANCLETLRAYAATDRFIQSLKDEPSPEFLQALMEDAITRPVIEPRSQQLSPDDPLDAELIGMGYSMAPLPLPRTARMEALLASIGERSVEDEREQQIEHGASWSFGSSQQEQNASELPDQCLIGVGGERHEDYDDIDQRLHTRQRFDRNISQRSPLAGALLVNSRLSRDMVCYDDSVECRASLERVTGPEETMRALVGLLTRALDVPVQSTQQRVITITWLLDALLLDHAHPLWNDWIRALREALDHGWNVRHLVRATSDQSKAFRLAEYTRAFLGAKGLYQPFLLAADSEWRLRLDETNGESFSGALCEYVIVSGVGGLRLIASDGMRINRCRLLAPDDSLELMESRLSRGFDHAEPLYKHYVCATLELLQAMLRIESQPGPRYALINGFGETTLPRALLRERAEGLLASGKKSRAEVDYILSLQEDRLRVMEQNLERYPHFDICPTSAIRRLIQKGTYQLQDAWTLRGAPTFTSEQVRTHLRYIIDRVESEPNYHLYLLLDEDAEFYISEFLAKPGYAAMVEFWHTDSSGKRLRADLEITESSMVAALHDRSYWDELSSHAIVDRAEVAKFLREQLARI